MKTEKSLRMMAIWLPVITFFSGLAAFMLPVLWIPVCGLALWGDARTKSFGASLAVLAAGCAAGVFVRGWPGLLVGFVLIFPLAAGLVQLRRGTPFLEGLGGTLIAAFIGIGGAAGILVFLSGGDLVTAFLQELQQAVLQDASGTARALLAGFITGTEYTSMNATALMERLQELIAMDAAGLMELAMPALDSLCRLMLPSLLAAATLLLGGGSYLIAGYCLRRSKMKNRPLPSYLTEKSLPPALAAWDLPRWVLVPVVLLMLAWMLMSWFVQDTWLAVAYALRQITDLVLAMQGMALIAWFGQRKRWPAVGWIFLILAAAVLMNGQILVFTGVADALFRFRHVIAFKDALEAEQRLKNRSADRQQPEEKEQEEKAAHGKDENSQEDEKK